MFITTKGLVERRAYRIHEFAEMLTVTERYVRKLASQDKIKIEHIGRRAVIFADEADRFIAQAKSSS